MLHCAPCLRQLDITRELPFFDQRVGLDNREYRFSSHCRLYSLYIIVLSCDSHGEKYLCSEILVHGTSMSQ